LFTLSFQELREEIEHANLLNQEFYMKAFALIVLLFTFASQAAEIVNARLDVSKKNILIDVYYKGGCQPREFSLDVVGCRGRFPQHCAAVLEERIQGVERCEASVFGTVILNLAEEKLDGSSFTKAFLTINGDKNYAGKQTSATVVLP
jgi:hypothetical protein